MSKVTPLSERKSDHIRINLKEDVRSGLKTGLERYHFNHRALPELDLDKIDLQVPLFDKVLQSPILISSMTGGTASAGEINRVLARAADAEGIAMGLGSQRAALEHPDLAATFQVRDVAPNLMLFANIGVIQLNYGYTVDHCRRAVEMVDADALILHFNPLQEAVQPEGDVNWSGLLPKIELVCKNVGVPVIAKEVGWGFAKEDVRMLKNCGISAVDVAGAGGTSWSQVEMHRATNESQARLAAAFLDWGIPTSEAILNVCEVDDEMIIFASGGLRTGLDIAKSIALGASLGGMASPFLKAAVISEEAVVQTIREIRREIQVCMFTAAAENIPALKTTPLIKR